MNINDLVAYDAAKDIGFELIRDFTFDDSTHLAAEIYNIMIESGGLSKKVSSFAVLDSATAMAAERIFSVAVDV